MGERRSAGQIALLAVLATLCGHATAQEPGKEPDPRATKLLAELRESTFRIVYESYRANNWELMAINADGSAPADLTKTAGVDEMFPRASPDGSRVCFVAETVKDGKRTRDVWCMNIDGTARIKVADHGRQPFWCPDGRRIGYLRGTLVTYSEGGRANKKLYFYDIETKTRVRHPNARIAGLLSPCMTPNGRWIVASAMGGMGFGHSIIAIQADGPKVVELARSHSEGKNIYQCRPDVSPNGRHVAWGKEDVDDRYGLGRRTMFVEVGDVDFSAPTPKVAGRRYVVTLRQPFENYHVDWSPDSRYIAYAQGKRGGRMAKARYGVGVRAPGWDIWVARADRPNVAVQITHDGLCNKEPDWVMVPEGSRR